MRVFRSTVTDSTRRTGRGSRCRNRRKSSAWSKRRERRVQGGTWRPRGLCHPRRSTLAFGDTSDIREGKSDDLDAAVVGGCLLSTPTKHAQRGDASGARTRPRRSALRNRNLQFVKETGRLFGKRRLFRKNMTHAEARPPTTLHRARASLRTVWGSPPSTSPQHCSSQPSCM